MRASVQAPRSARASLPPFSTFADKAEYAGAVPTGNYISTVYVEYGFSITPYMANELKKRLAEWVSGLADKVWQPTSWPSTATATSWLRPAAAAVLH